VNLLIQEDINLNKLKIHISKALKKDIYANRKISCCPNCNGNRYIKYGLYNKIQRYKCKDCEKTFSNATNSIWSYLKKTPDKWIEFLELMLEKKTLRFCAKKLDISLVTAFYWRHKVLRGLVLDDIPKSLDGDIHMGKSIKKENFKGCRNIQTFERRNIWIVGAQDTKGSMLVKPICKDFWKLKYFDEKIYSRVTKEAYIIPYADRYLAAVAKRHNKKLLRKSKKLTNLIIEDKPKCFMLSLNSWFRSFCGIATKYLEEYLKFFILFNLHRKINYMDMLYHLSFGDRFVKTSQIRILQDLTN
jgi:transposase-like protein